MRIIKYGFYGEDDAQKIFLKNYLKLLRQAKFEMDDAFCRRFRASNNKKVDNRFRAVSQEGFLSYQLDVLFVGRDLDRYSVEDYTQKMEWFQKTAYDAQKTLFMVPVQAIEHWLWYLKIRKDNPKSTKNEPLETKPRQVAKEVVYGIADAVNAISNPIVEELSAQFEVEWLESRSPSFRSFHQQVKRFLVQNNA